MKLLTKIQNKNNFSKPQLAIFILAFALIGYFIFRSFAAVPLVASLEAEQMSLPTGGSVVSDSNASAGKAIELSSNGTASGTVNFPSSVSSLAVVARGDQCSGAPLMNVAIDGNGVFAQSVSATSWSSYAGTDSVAAGTHTLTVSFTNDYSSAGKAHGKSGKSTGACDRNLYVDVTNFYGPDTITPAPTVTLSASPSSVTAGQASTLTWGSTNATSCTASDAWAGPEPTSGSAVTGALNQNSTYTLTCTGAGGSASASATVTVTNSSIVNAKPFSSSSAINQAIPTNPPIHPDTLSMIQNNPNWVLPSSSPYKEWLGPRQRIQYQKVILSSTPMVTIHVNYDDALGYGCDRHVVTAPMPDTIQYAYTNLSFDHDGVNWIVDENGNSWESFALTPPGTASRDISCNTNQWNALRYDYWGPNTEGNEATGLGYGTNKGASASKIKVGAGSIRPEDMQLPAGSNLGHALRIDGCLGSDGSYATHPRFVPPAMSGDGVVSGAAGIPYGARLQLDPAINVDDPTNPYGIKGEWQRMILRTLQAYGAIVVDHSCPAGSGGLESVNSYPIKPYIMPWEQAGYGWGYDNGIPYNLMSHFRVIDWTKWTGV